MTLTHISSAVGSLGFRTLELKQGLESVSHLIFLWDTATSEFNLLRFSLECLQLEFGSMYLSLNKYFSLCAHLDTPGWLASVWEYLDFYHPEITIPSLTLTNPSSANDVAIVDFAIALKHFNMLQIKQIDTFRLALKSYFISDLLRPRSNAIMDCYWKGSKDKFSKSLFNWPRSVPRIKYVTTWKLFLRAIATADKVLLRTINSSRSSSCHRISVVKIYSEQQLMQIEGGNHQWFYLRRASRHMHNLRHESVSKSHQLQLCFIEEAGLKVKL